MPAVGGCSSRTVSLYIVAMANRLIQRAETAEEVYARLRGHWYLSLSAALTPGAGPGAHPRDTGRPTRERSLPWVRSSLVTSSSRISNAGFLSALRAMLGHALVDAVDAAILVRPRSSYASTALDLRP